MWKLMMLSFTIMVASGSFVQAQTKYAAGIVLGGSYNMHTGSALEKTGTGVGLVGGGRFEVAFTKYFSLQTTIYAYDNRIGKYSTTLTQDSIDYSLDYAVTVAYAGIEPLLKFTLPDNRFYVLVGPSMGFKVQGQSEVTTTITTPGYSFSTGYSFQTTTSEIPDINTHFEILIGGGYSLAMDGQSRLTTQLSLAYGLNKIQNNVDWRINSIRLIIGLEFDVFH